METRLASAVCEASLLRSTLDGKSKAFEVLKAQFANQTAEITALRTELASLRDKNVAAETTARQARLNEERLEKRFELVKSELEKLVVERSSLESQLQELQHVADQLNSLNVPQSVKDALKMEWIAELDMTDEPTWRSQFLALRREMDLVATELELRAPDMEKLVKQCAEAQAEATKFSNELQESKKRNTELESELQATKSLAHDLRDLQTANSHRINDLRQQVLCLLSEKLLDRALLPNEQRQLADLRKECERSQDENKDIVSTNFVLFKSVADVQFQNERLLHACRSLAAELDTKISLEEVEEVTKTLETLQLKYNKLNLECLESKRANEDLRKKLEAKTTFVPQPAPQHPIQPPTQVPQLSASAPNTSAASANAAKLVESEAKVQDLQRARAVLEQELASLRLEHSNAIVQLESVNAANQTSLHQINLLSQELAEKTGRLELLSSQISEKDSSLAKLTADLMAHDSAATARSEELASVVRDLRQLAEQRPSSQSDLQRQLEEQEVQHKQRDNELVEQVNNLEDQVVQLQEDCSKQAAERASVANKLAEAESGKALLEEELRQAKQRVEELESKESELNSLKEKLESINTELVSAKDELTGTKGELTDTRNELSTAKSELEAAKSSAVNRTELEDQIRNELRPAIEQELRPAIEQELRSQQSNQLEIVKPEPEQTELVRPEPEVAKSEPEEITLPRDELDPVVRYDDETLRSKLVAKTSEEEVKQFESELLEAEQARVKELVKSKLDTVQKEVESKCEKRFEIRSKLVGQKVLKLEKTNSELQAKIDDLVARNRRLKGGLPEDDSNHGSDTSSSFSNPPQTNAFGLPATQPFNPVVNAFAAPRFPAFDRQDPEKRPSQQDQDPKKSRTE